LGVRLPPLLPKMCRPGGMGRRAAFKTQCHATWGFDAPGRHHNNLIRRDGRVRFKALAPKARAPSGAAGSNPRSLLQFVHARQIRLAAPASKTVTPRSYGGSNPLACTRVYLQFPELFLFFRDLGWRSGPSRYPHEVETARSNRAPRTAASSNDRIPLCRRGWCEFDSRRSRHVFCRCTLVWFGGCSFNAPLFFKHLSRGFSPVTGATLAARFSRDVTFGSRSESMMLEIISNFQLTYIEIRVKLVLP